MARQFETENFHSKNSSFYLGNDKKHGKQQTPTPRNPVFGKWQKKQRSFSEIRRLGNDKGKCKTINFQLQNSYPEKL